MIITEKSETLLTISLNTHEGNSQHKHKVFDRSEVQKLKEEIIKTRKCHAKNRGCRKGKNDKEAYSRIKRC